MNLGIIGLPSSGKTTVFNALTKGEVPTGQSMGGRFDVHSSMVDVPDERVDKLKAMYKPKKTTYTRVTYSDVAGIKKGDGDNKQGFDGPLLNHLAGLDGFVHVVRGFESMMVPHPDGSVDPGRDLAALDGELLFNDLIRIEGKLERIESGMRKGAIKNKGEALAEKALFERLHAVVSAEKPLRTLELTSDEEKSLRGYGLLTLKPILVLINIGDDDAEVQLDYDVPRSLVANLRGRLEMELSQMEGEDLEFFMEEYGVTELGLDRVIALSYDLLGVHSFLTVGEDEVRAWTVKRNATAVEAAGAIHSDLAKGFIRAEVVAQADLLTLGSMAKARSEGKLRLEGKTYIVQDGDILNIKHNM